MNLYIPVQVRDKKELPVMGPNNKPYIIHSNRAADRFLQDPNVYLKGVNFITSNIRIEGSSEYERITEYSYDRKVEIGENKVESRRTVVLRNGEVPNELETLIKECDREN